MAKDPAELAAERPVGDKAANDVNSGVATAGAAKGSKESGPPRVGDDAWLPS
jgi:hypothetical protein